MISEIEIDQIQTIISVFMSLGDSFEGTEEDFLLKNNYNEIDYLPIFHEMLTSPFPSVYFHIFAFLKLKHIIQNFSDDWVFNSFDEISRWLIAYAEDSADFVFESPRVLFGLFVQTYIALVVTAASKYPYFQSFWNSLASHFTANVYKNSINVSLAALALLGRLLAVEEEAAAAEKDFNLKSNRKTVFNFCVQTLEVVFQTFLGEDAAGVDALVGTAADLVALAFDTVVSVRDLVQPVHFRIFFAYSNFFIGNEVPLSLCEASLLSGEGDDAGTDAVLAIEEAMLSAGEREKGRFESALRNEANLLYFSKFVEIARRRWPAQFSLAFVGRLAALAAGTLGNDVAAVTSEATLNFVSFLANYSGDGYSKPSKLIQTAFFSAIMKAVSENPKQSVAVFGLNSQEESPFISLLSVLYRLDFSEFAGEIKKLILENLGIKDQSERNDAVTARLSLFLRIVEQIVRHQISIEKDDFIEDLLKFIFIVQKEFLLPFLAAVSHAEEVQPSSVVPFTEGELLSFLLFDSFFFESDEFAFFSAIGCDEYNDFTQLAIGVVHLVMRSFTSNEQLFELSLHILTNICEEKSDNIFFDVDFMLNEEKAINFDVVSESQFNFCSTFYEALFAHELRATQPRIHFFLGLYQSRFLQTIHQPQNEEQIHQLLFDFAFYSGIIQGLAKFNQRGQINFEMIETEILIHKNEEANAAEVEFEEEEEDVDIESEKDEAKKYDKKDEIINNQDISGDEEESETHSKIIFDFLYQNYFSIFCQLIENFAITKSDFDSEDTSDDVLNSPKSSLTRGFLIFMIKFSSLIETIHFELHSPDSSIIFRQIASTVKSIIECTKAKIISINKQESDKEIEWIEEQILFNESRQKCFSILTLCINLAARVLGSGSVSFGAFLIYDDSLYRNFLNAIIDIIEYIGFEHIFSSQKGGKNDNFNLDDISFTRIFDLRFSFFALVRSIFSIHVSIVLPVLSDEKSSNFENFYKSTFSIIEKFDENGELENGYCHLIVLLSSLIHQLIEIFYFNGKNCFAFLIVQDEIECALKKLYREIFLEKNKKCRLFGDVRLSVMFAEFSIMDDCFVGQVAAETEAACQLFKRAKVSKILNEIEKAAGNHELQRTKDLFESFFSIWFDT